MSCENAGGAAAALCCSIPPRGAAKAPRTVLLTVLLALAALLDRQAPALAQDSIRIDDFDKSHAAGELPKGWDKRKFSPTIGDGADYFFRFTNDPEHFVHLRSGANNSFTVGRDRKFRLQDYRFLEWEWRVTVLPKGGDVRVKAKDDQAGSICVVHNPGLIGAETLCYIWENQGPKGAELTSTKREESKYIILRAADSDETGAWFAEKRNIYEDFRRLFGKEPNREAVIGFQIDSNDTGSTAEVFYRNVILKRP